MIIRDGLTICQVMKVFYPRGSTWVAHRRSFTVIGLRKFQDCAFETQVSKLVNESQLRCKIKS